MNQGQLELLAVELGDDPLALGLAAASDAAAADLLNATTRTVPRDIPLGEFQSELIRLGKWASLKAVAAGPRPDGEAGALWDAIVGSIDLIMAGQATVIAMTRPQDAALVGAQLDGLVAAGMLSADDRAALLALGVQPGSRAQELGIGFVTPSDIAEARRLIS